VNSILKIAPHGILAIRVATTLAVRGISRSPMSSLHSVPRNLADTGLSAGVSRNGLAAYPDTRINIVIIIAAVPRQIMR
jgi:hypothetical protein